MQLVSEDIQAYANACSTPEPDLFQELARETRASQKDHVMMVGHCEGMLLRTLVTLSRARRVLEIGTFTGYSALAMASALPDDGELITCDVDANATALARRYWDRSPHGKKIHLRLAPALDTIPTLTSPIDFVFIDADKPNYIRYWEAVLPLVRAGGVVVADNVLWSGRVLEPKEKSDHALAAFNMHVNRDDRVEHVMLPIRDGVTIAVKR
ncbi:MAG TPA: class I SAM-dependent methyltransferase [Candidatus Krumholzibacteria bacterium]|nr:class I SAM-dependent methyltransferase [Candidatus Krumholzibacteria bacterium]